MDRALFESKCQTINKNFWVEARWVKAGSKLRYEFQLWDTDGNGIDYVAKIIANRRPNYLDVRDVKEGDFYRRRNAQMDLIRQANEHNDKIRENVRKETRDMSMAMADDMRTHFRDYISEGLGYIAHKEENDTSKGLARKA